MPTDALARTDSELAFAAMTGQGRSGTTGTAPAPPASGIPHTASEKEFLKLTQNKGGWAWGRASENSLSGIAGEAPSTPMSHTVFKFFFASHIPATCLIDTQVLLPKTWVPPMLSNLAEWYANSASDHLMLTRPLWFKSLVSMEVACQLPFFAAATYAFHHKKNWIRLPAIVYASHAITQMVPILATVLFDSAVPDTKRALLTSVYLPYFAGAPACASRPHDSLASSRDACAQMPACEGPGRMQARLF